MTAELSQFGADLLAQSQDNDITASLSDIFNSQPSYKHDDPKQQSVESMLRQAWINERNAPDLLMYEDGIVDHMKNLVRTTNEELSEGVDESHDLERFKLAMRRLEVARVTYVLADYHRCRWKKIQSHSLFVCSDPEMVKRCSEPEQRALHRFVDQLGAAMDGQLLKHLPDKFRNLINSRAENQANMLPEFPVDGFVFMQAKQDIGVVQLDDSGDEEVELLKGNIFLASYRKFKVLIQSDHVELI